MDSFMQDPRRINTRQYCPKCDRTGSERKPDGSCSICGGTVYKTMADFWTIAERVEKAFPIKLTNDNEGRTHHFSSARKRRLALENDLRLYGFFRHQAPLFKQKVTLTRLLGPGERFWDWDSVLRGNAKELIDALAALKFFLNDSPRWVVGVSALQDDRLRKLGGGVRIVIERAE